MCRRGDKTGGWLKAARIAALSLAVLLPACERLGAGSEARDDGDVFSLSFEDRPQPGVFVLQAPAVRDAGDGAAGLWAAVDGLDRPERAEAVNLDTGDVVALALYRASRAGAAIRLSNEAADALGVGDEPVNIRITALRRKPVVATR